MKRLRLPLFLALCAVQLAIPLAMAYRYERTLREGAVYRFHTEPFDPVDAFRGRYVAIRLRLLGAGAHPGSRDRWSEKVYVTLGRDSQGFATVRALSEEPPAGGDWLSGTLAEDVYEDLPPRPADAPPERPARLGTRIELPFDRYYMEEGNAPQAERAVRGLGPGMDPDALGRSITAFGPQMDVTARVRVRQGLGAIEGLDVNGVPIERWLATVPP